MSGALLDFQLNETGLKRLMRSNPGLKFRILDLYLILDEHCARNPPPPVKQTLWVPEPTKFPTKIDPLAFRSPFTKSLAAGVGVPPIATNPLPSTAIRELPALVANIHWPSALTDCEYPNEGLPGLDVSRSNREVFGLKTVSGAVGDAVPIPTNPPGAMAS